jgi:phosphoribosylaminoimidazole carboxylase (NCAIR synthetase)
MTFVGMAKKCDPHTTAATAARVAKQAAKTLATAHELQQSLAAVRIQAHRLHQKLNINKNAVQLAG